MLPSNYIWPKWILLIGSVLALTTCTRFELTDYMLDDLPSRPVEDLIQLADTGYVLPLIAHLPENQRLDSFIYYAEWLKYHNADVALQYARMAYELATKNNWNVPRGVSAYRMARIKGSNRAILANNVKSAYIEDALVDARISRRLLEPYENAYWKLNLDMLMGYLYRQSGNLDSARYYFDRSLQQSQKLAMDRRVTNLKQATLYQEMAYMLPHKDSLRKLDFFGKSDSLYSILGNEQKHAGLWLDQSAFYQYHNEFERADSFYHLALEYGNRREDNNILEQTYFMMGYSYLRQFRLYEQPKTFDKALKYLQQALQYDPYNEYRINTLIGSLYQASWAIDIDESHADTAILYYKKAMAGASARGDIHRMRSLSDNIIDLCNYGGGLHQAALGERLGTFINQHYSGVVDTLMNETKSAYGRINRVEQQDILTNAAILRRNQLAGSGIIIFTAIAVFLIALQRLQNRRLRAEMQALRAQINPHFVSNSLNAIESLINLGRTREASKYLVHFSRLSRQILTGSHDAVTNVANEIKTLRHFLALEQLRFRDNLTYEIKIDPAVDQEHAQIPSMMLQPYVENAIWHGLKPKPNGGHIHIELFKQGKQLVCSVEDNGIGREQAEARKQAFAIKHNSVGMKITEDRIRAMGRVKGPSVEIFDLHDVKGYAKGTRVVIRLPYRI